MSKIYAATSLTGSTSGSLASINGSILSNSDAAIAFTNNIAYIYYLDANSGAAEHSPDVIKPLFNANNKRWILIAYGAFSVSIDTSQFDGIFDSTITNVQTALDTIDNLFNLTDFTVTTGFVSLTDSVVKSSSVTGGTVVTPISHRLPILGDNYRIQTETNVSQDSVFINLLKLNVDFLTDDDIDLTLFNDILFIDSTTVNSYVTLPLASTKDIIRIIQNVNGNTCEISPFPGDYIFATNPYILNGYGEAVEFVSDGVNTWYPKEVSSTELENIRDFIGKPTQGNITPPYTSFNFFDSTSNLTVAISALDSKLKEVDDIVQELDTVKNGVSSISNGASTKSITFTTPYPSTSYSLNIDIQNIVDVPASMYLHTITQKLTTGFTITFSGTMDSANYRLNWYTKLIV